MDDLGQIAKVDFTSEFQMEPAVSAKVKAGVIAAKDLSALAASLDADLLKGCSGLAKDLDAGATFESGVDACSAAIKAMGNVQSKLGAEAEIGLELEPPTCGASLDAMASCAGTCDADLKPGSIDVTCEGGELSGTCDAQCNGTCEVASTGTCGGSCSGSCSAEFSGTCHGTCEGACDGAGMSGYCPGTCEGACDSGAAGACGGACDGSCELASSATCDGTCAGECSVAFKEPSCSGKLVPPKMSAECQASCQAHAAASLTCTPPTIGISIKGAADAEAAAQYAAALKANLPTVLKVAVGMAPKLLDVLATGKTTIEGGISAGQAVIKGAPTAAPHVLHCLVEPFTDAVGAVADIQASISISVDVQASATASGSASTEG